MEDGGISRTFFWMCYRTQRDPDKGGEPLEKAGNPDED